MDGRKKLEAQPESKKDPNDDEIIDLEQVIKKENDDDIIDLTHVLEQPDTKTNDEDRMTEADDTIIELSAPMITVNDEDAGNDEVIDLEGMETTFEADLSGSSTSDDEDILDLLDTVESDDLSDPTRPLDETSDADDVIEEDEDMQDDVIDLMDAVPPVLPSGGVDETAESVPPADVIPTAASDSDAVPIDADDQKDVPNAMRPMDKTDVLDTASSSAAATLAVTEQQIEAALEHTIHKVYAEKIEQLLIQTIEKTIRREIEKIKHALMENDDGGAD